MDAKFRMKFFEHKSGLWLTTPVEEIFDFFSDARNLQAITPDWLDFQIVTPCPVQMKPGALIDYKLRVHGIPIKWRTRINLWEPPRRFVDEQIRGPYKLWVHEHRFEPQNNGTLVLDHVKYMPRGGWLAHKLFVKRDVEKIFAFRKLRLEEIGSQRR